MSTATLTSKGQATIPKDVRDFLHLTTGDKLDFVMEASGVVTLRPANIHINHLKGILHRAGRKPVSLEEMDRAIAESAIGLQS